MIGISNYSGVFDGNYKTVSGLYSKVLGRDLGFFGKVLGTVKNVGVIDSYFGGTGGSIGSVAASLHSDGTIQNCYFDGQICATLANASLGGIIGYGNNGCTIINCFNYGRVTSTDNDCRVGAIVGALSDSANIQNCYYLSGCAVAGDITRNGIGYRQNGADASDTVGVIEAKSAEAFAYSIRERSFL